jgi:hypothetical protein
LHFRIRVGHCVVKSVLEFVHLFTFVAMLKQLYHAYEECFITLHRK